jgi:Family of unknown function (DUF6184)
MSLLRAGVPPYRGIVLLVLGGAGAIGSCHASAQKVPPTTSPTLTGAELGTSSNDDAVMKVATSRCDRELACNKIGQGRAHDDQPTCLERMGELMNEEAGKNTCPAGVEPFALSACLLDIQKTPCGGELERSSNIRACTKASLCVR